MLKALGPRAGVARGLPHACRGVVIEAISSTEASSCPHQQQQTRHMSVEPTPAKRYNKLKGAYKADIKAIRKQFIEDVKQRADAEAARKKEEREKMLAEKRKRLLAKRAEQLVTQARVTAERTVQTETFRLYIEKMQEVRDQKDEVLRQKQHNLLTAFKNESLLWVDSRNAEEKITERLFTLAGKTTASPTRHSENWRYMAVPHLPDFSQYDEEELFDEKEDVHFLTDKSPWNQEIIIPEGHELYSPGPVRASLAGDLEDPSAEESDGNIYFEDAIYRPSYIDTVYAGGAKDFQPRDLKTDELEDLKAMAEMYEEEMFTHMVEEQVDEEEERGGTFDPDKKEEEEGR